MSQQCLLLPASLSLLASDSLNLVGFRKLEPIVTACESFIETHTPSILLLVVSWEACISKVKLSASANLPPDIFQTY